jgi:hypothetical protein
MLGTMRINLSRDIDVFLANAGRWLTKDPVGNNVLLTTIAAQHAGHVKGGEEPLYAWAEDRGEILGAMRWPPPLPAGATLRAIGFEPTTNLTDFQFGDRQLVPSAAASLFSTPN